MINASRENSIRRECAEVQQLERSSIEKPSGDLPGGTDLQESPSKDEPPIAVNSARKGGYEPSGGYSGSSTGTGYGKYSLHHYQRDDIHLLEKKLIDKDKTIGQLVDTLDFLSTNTNSVEQLKKEVDELKNIIANLKRENEQLRSYVKRFNHSEVSVQSSLTNEQKMDDTRAAEGAEGALEGGLRDPSRSDQGSIVSAPEDEDVCHSCDSYVLCEPMNLEKTGIEDLPNSDEVMPWLLQIKEHEEAYRKERNDRVMLKQKYKTLERDLKVVSQEKDLALLRAEKAEVDAKKAKEEQIKLRERLERISRGPSTRSAPSSQRSSIVSSPHRGTDSQPVRDPLTCVWPPNNYHLIPPPDNRPSQEGEQSRDRNSSLSEFVLVARGRGEENQSSSEGHGCLECDEGESVSKRERSASIVSPLEYDEIDDIKRNIKKFDEGERWSCQACTYKNRARRSMCSYCGTVDAVQRQRHNNNRI
jgi:hypothetical protein